MWKLASWAVCRVALLLLLLAGHPVQALQAPDPTRLALVIGNAAYRHPDDVLTGPKRDRQAIAGALRKVGFNVTEAQDLDKAGMNAAIAKFKAAVTAAGPTAIGVFYYAGHGGAPAKGFDNYLLPIDVPQIATADMAAQGLSVRSIVESLETIPERRAIVVIIDACRTRDQQRGPGSSRGGALRLVSPDEPARGHLIAYSTSSGRPASDNGDYAAALASRFTSKGLTLDQVFEGARLALSKNQWAQLPLAQSNLTEKVCLVSCDSDGATAADPFGVIKRASEVRAAGDVGQVAAIGQLVGDGKSLAGAQLPGTYFRGAALAGGDISKADLRLTDFQDSALAQSNLAESDFSFAQLKNAKAVGATATRALFYFVQAQGAVFSKLHGEGSNWMAASLRGADFRGAQLRGASFMMADLRNADFTGADLRGAFFIGSLISGANFASAQIGNTDFSAAIGSASQFSALQQAGLCGTDTTKGVVQVHLRRFDPTRELGNRYPQFVDAWVPLAGGLRYLEPCARRTEMPAGKEPVWLGRDTEYVTDGLTLDFSTAMLDSAGREAAINSHARNTLAVLSQQLKEGKAVAVLGKRHLALLEALRANVAKTRLESPPRFDIDATFMYQVRYRPESIPPEKWRWLAMEHVATENRDPSNDPNRNRWPRFFPKGTSANELGDDDVQLFRRWTLARAAQYPTRIPLEAGTPELQGALSNVRKQGDDGAPTSFLEVAPLDFYASRQDVQSLKRYPELAGDANVMRVSDAALRLRKPIKSHTIRVPRDVAPQLRNSYQGARVMLEIRGMTILTAGDQQMRVLDADVAELRLLLRDGTKIP